MKGYPISNGYKIIGLVAAVALVAGGMFSLHWAFTGTNQAAAVLGLIGLIRHPRTILPPKD